MTEKDLIKAGYKRYSDYSGLFRYSDFFYQKKVVDKKGTKYFIEMIHYSAHYKDSESWMCHLSTISPHYTFEQHHVDDLKKCEKNCEKFFQTMGCEYYEKETKNRQ